MDQRAIGSAWGAPWRGRLVGPWAILEPLDARRHGSDLWSELVESTSLWRFMSSGPFMSEESFATWLTDKESSSDPLFFSVLDAHSRCALGLLALLAIRPAHGVAELGHIVFSPALQRTRAATDAIALIARFVFDELGYRRLEWKCDNLNGASKRAARRFGFCYEGLFRQHMVVKNRSRDTSWFSLLDHDWPQRRAALEHWLAPENFDKDGRQKTRLRRRGCGAVP